VGAFCQVTHSTNVISYLKIHFDIFIHSYALTLATGLPMQSSMDLLLSQEEIDK
jgi:hypothetical protein